MKSLLSICIITLMLSACQTKPAKNETILIPTPNGVPAVSVAQPGSSAERPALNPEHGQPFHDCALPVGAPLASKEASVKTPVITAPAAPAKEIEVKQPVIADKEVKLNPAHGEPGHKCEVSVGAPLS